MPFEDAWVLDSGVHQKGLGQMHEYKGGGNKRNAPILDFVKQAVFIAKKEGVGVLFLMDKREEYQASEQPLFIKTQFSYEMSSIPR